LGGKVPKPAIRGNGHHEVGKQEKAVGKTRNVAGGDLVPGLIGMDQKSHLVKTSFFQRAMPVV